MERILPNFCIILFLLAGVFHLQAQVPQKFNYQAIARNANGAILPNQNIKARFSIRNGSGAGSIIFQETKSFTTNQFGLFTHQVGTGDSIQGNIAGVNWVSNSKFLQVEIDPAGGNNFTDLGAAELVSVPYALHAGNSGSVNGTVNYLAKFTPNGTTAGNSLVFDNGSQVLVGTTVVPSASPKFTVNQTGVGAAGYFNIGNAGSSSNALFAQTNGTGFALETGTGDVHITNDLGIGTTSPQSKLHISTNSASGIGAYIENTVAGNGASLGFIINSGGAVSVGGAGYSSINNELGIVSNNRDVALRASSGYIKINNGSGNVGVNTATPNSTLQVSGSLAVGVGSASSIGTSAGTGTLLTGTSTFILLNPVNANSYFRLPQASTCTGRMYILYNVGANTAILERTGTDTFIGATGSVGTVVAMPFNAIGKMAHLISDGNNWIVGFYN